MPAMIPILLYHSVSDADARDSFSVSPRLFADHLEVIASAGRTSMTITEVADCLRGVRSFPDRSDRDHLRRWL